jgi:molybdenum cofactor guanylyltransferase
VTYTFHPHEVALCGFSGSGKTTLCVKLIERLSKRFSVGYAKHSGHGFDIDKPGKDTHLAHAAGASTVHIVSTDQFAAYGTHATDYVAQRCLFSGNDMVLAEGWKSGAMPRIVMVADNDVAQTYLSEQTRKSGKILCWVTPTANVVIDDDRRAFARDDAAGLADFIASRFDARTAQTPLYGLVLAGGQSSRMQSDKASLEYKGRSQLENAFDLLSDHCDPSFVSARDGQWSSSRFSHLAMIPDRYHNLGPMAGILSAMAEHPQAAWCVIACDLPFLDSATLAHLIAERDPYKLATAYISANDGLPEPLCAIYEPAAQSRLWQFISLGYRCPRKVLINSNTNVLTLQNKRALENVNHPDEYRAASLELKN